MQIKKIVAGIGIVLFAAVLSGCGEDTGGKEKLENGGPLGLLDVNKEAQKNIADATKKTNDDLNKALNEDNNMNSKAQAPVADPELIKKYPFATIKTNQGDIKVKFYGEKTPLTVTNFLQLASDKFYDGARFHRVIKGFMIQAGDPLSKDPAMQQRWGTGGPGYQFKDELAGTEKYPQGTLAMANAGPNTNGSQFFIVTASPEAKLPASYTVFGTVVEGLENAIKIENVQTGLADRPVSDVIIESVTPSEK